MNRLHQRKVHWSAWCLLLTLTVSCARGAEVKSWAPSENPSPFAILEEAERDAAAHRYEVALAKHVWVHENALRIAPAMRGVRLSFALNSWIELGKKYPPALKKLKSIRDDDEKKARTDEASRGLFQDIVAINQYLGEVARSKDLFLWLDSNNPAFAKDVYQMAQPALVKSKEFLVCGKYLDPDNSFKRMIERLHFHQNAPGARIQEFGNKLLANEAASLVALLVKNGRSDEADRIADAAAKELNNPSFVESLRMARSGVVPEPWP